ncbi:nitrogenase component 1 [Holophaga foetida]|uniref:nitrogenase component 1 n=1 Tax=Holophaga foetida TaxID=35839 RepID=UPI00024753A1|nr:nitrogenase component 1 [Holophaga foetida]
MKQIAIYGKGGIGKSTLSANLSAAMALQGAKVLQIGCDPKQDSTRLLLEGRRLPTVLDYLRHTGPSGRRLEDVVERGFADIDCVEAGGPEPGVGCAGRGILSAFQMLETLGLQERGYDITLYDVLGDVVCGGFAVPLREAYADLVYIVTSGEFMALYAANNILRGIRNFESGGYRVGGILLNRRGLPDETDRVNRFAEAVQVPLLLDLPRNDVFMEAERKGQTLAQAFRDHPITAQFGGLATAILQGGWSFPARPLDPEVLESRILGHHVAIPARPPSPELPIRESAPIGAIGNVPQGRYWSKSVRSQEILHGCAFNGAVHTALQVKDSLTLVHGPRSCAFISEHGRGASARRNWFRHGLSPVAALAAPLHCTAMDERVAIFGGGDLLEAGLDDAIQRAPNTIFVATTCAAGIIGDDVERALTARQGGLVGLSVLPLKADGNLTGDYMQGIIDAVVGIAERFIDPEQKPEGNFVNLVAEKNLATNTEGNFVILKALLGALGIGINCRFIRDTSTEEIRGFKKAKLNILASEDAMGRAVRDFLVDRFQVPFLEVPYPVGFGATCLWLQTLGELFGKEGEARALIAENLERYEQGIERLRPAFEGLRVLIVTPNHRVDWILELALELGMEIVKVGILPSAWDDTFHTRYARHLPVVTGYTREQRDRDIRELMPDLTLANTVWPTQPAECRVELLPYCPDAGFFAGLDLAERWRRSLLLPPREGWRNDL